MLRSVITGFVFSACLLLARPAHSQDMLLDPAEIVEYYYTVNDTFHKAIEDQDLPAFQRLLKQGVSLTYEEGDQTPLMRAARVGSLSIVRLLVAHKADVNAISSTGATALMTAADMGQTQIVKYFLSKGARVNVVDKNGLTALERVMHF